MYLMSKNNILSKIDFDKMIFDIYKPNLMPFALRGQGVSLFTVRDWMQDRVLDIHRVNAKKIISSLGLNQNNRIQICYACKGLSLTDCYWLKAENDTKSTWDNVSLYRNSLSNAISKIALTGEYVSIQGKIRTPEVTGQGVYAKCWRRANGGIYLYKSGSRQGSGIEHLIDVLCSYILDYLRIEHVRYSLTTIDNKEVSKCKNITTEELSICDMEYFQGYCNRNGINLNNWLSKQPLYYKMLIADYLMFNTDRHSGNWGVYFDANTGKELKLHPLFDHNNALDSSGDPMSKVISGKTLEECARYAKKHVDVDTTQLEKWLKTLKTKKTFKSVFGNLNQYNSLLQRIKTYNSW